MSAVAAEHAGPLLRLAQRAAHQMTEVEEHLYAELTTTGASAWGRLQADVTSQLTAPVTHPDGHVETLPMPAVRGLARMPTRRCAAPRTMRRWPPGRASPWRARPR